VGEARELSNGLAFVHGKPAVVASGLGGNAAPAREPMPGVIAYVGCSGAPSTGASSQN